MASILGLFCCACNRQRLVCLVFVLLCLMVFSACEEENTLTIDVVAADQHVPNWNTLSSDDVRCYCNLPVCVATGYMCKSEGGGCFSEVVDPEQPASKPAPDVYKGRHGCLELLHDKNQRTECRNMPSKGLPGRSHSKSLLWCCFKDMCNHMDSPETQTILNGTLSGSIVNDSPSVAIGGGNPQHDSNMSPPPSYHNSELWFKTAIIAVPICGIVILLLLILLAVKILRTDTLSSSSKLGSPYAASFDRKLNKSHFDQIHHPPNISLTKLMLSAACTTYTIDDNPKTTAVPLLLQNETSVNKKNETNAKLNTANGHEYNLLHASERNAESPLLGLQKSMCNSMYRNVNLSLNPAPTTPAVEKLYDKEGLSAVICWGAPSPSSSPV